MYALRGGVRVRLRMCTRGHRMEHSGKHARALSLSLSFSFSLSLFLSFSLSLAPSLPRSLAPSLPPPSLAPSSLPPRSLSLSLGAPALESGTRSPCWPTRCLLRPAGCRLPTCSRGEQSTTGTRWCGRLACPAAAPGSVALAPILPARRVSALWALEQRLLQHPKSVTDPSKDSSAT